MPSTGALIRLGHRLRDEPSDEDKAAFDAYRAEFQPALQEVADLCQSLVPEARFRSARLKTLESTIAKLQRQQIRLNRIQDIAGVRVVVPDPVRQDGVVAVLQAAFPHARVDDYRNAPQNGYRAVHVVVEATDGRAVEIQVRTTAQNVWANLSELLAHAVDPGIKYGLGPSDALDLLASLSSLMLELDEVAAIGEVNSRRLRTLSEEIEEASRGTEVDQARAGALRAQLREVQVALGSRGLRLRAIDTSFAEHTDHLSRIIEERS